MAIDYDLYRGMPGIVLGFHGCDASVGEAVLSGKVKHLKPSQNAYDWLGSGIYFWENDPRRAMEFAVEGTKAPVTKGKIKKPFVIGAAIDLGLCLNLMERESLEEVAQAHEALKALCATSGTQMPENKGRERALRFLDRAVLEMVHVLRAKLDGSKYPPFDSVRGAFLEGDEPYPGAGFKMKNHIQLAIRSPSCIKGYFRPMES